MSILFFILSAFLPGSAGPLMLHAPFHNSAPVGFLTVTRDTATINGQWYLQPVFAADTATGKFPMLRIDRRSGTFTGNTGCNNMSGSFRLSDSSIQFNQAITRTRMQCTGYDEAAFLKSLLQTNRYQLKDGMLILLFNNTELTRWTRQPDRKIKIKHA